MQNMDTKEFQKCLENYDYKRVRSNGSSHVVYEREIVIKDTISVPVNGKTINGPMAKRLLKQMQDFESKVVAGLGRIKE